MKKYAKTGLNYKDYKSMNDYGKALKSHKDYLEKKELSEFIAKQVNGTIFASEGSEGEIL